MAIKDKNDYKLLNSVLKLINQMTIDDKMIFMTSSYEALVKHIISMKNMY